MRPAVTEKPKTVLEADLRSILRDADRFPSGTVSFAEFGFGGDPGLPDCLISSRGELERILRPVELKLGNSVVSGLRPSQRRWHKDSLRVGLRTFGLTISKSRIVRGFELELEGLAIIERLKFEVGQGDLDFELLQNELFN